MCAALPGQAAGGRSVSRSQLLSSENQHLRHQQVEAPLPASYFLLPVPKHDWLPFVNGVRVCSCDVTIQEDPVREGDGFCGSL